MALKKPGKRLVPLVKRAHLKTNKAIDIEVEHEACVGLGKLVEIVGSLHQGMVSKAVQDLFHVLDEVVADAVAVAYLKLDIPVFSSAHIKEQWQTKIILLELE